MHALFYIHFQESLKIDDNVDNFLDAVTNQLHGYINHLDFRDKILQKVAKSWRLRLGVDANTHIEAEIKEWENKYLPQIYMDTFVKNLDDKLKHICSEWSTDLMRGFKMPYDPDNSILVGLFQTAFSIMGGIAIRAYLFEPHIAIGVATLGVTFSGLSTFGYIKDFNSVRERTVDVRIGNLSKTEIKNKLKNNFSRDIKNNMEKALNTMKCEIEKLRQEAIERETKNNIDTSRMRICMELDERVFECKQRLQNIEKKVFIPKDTRRSNITII